MEFSFRPRNDSGRPQLSALLSALGAEVFSLKEACVLILSRLPPQVPWRRFLHVLGKLGYAPQKGKAGSARSFRNSTRNPNVVTFREPHPGQNVCQTMLHEYLRKLLLSPDEFMRLLEDCKRLTNAPVP